MLGIASNKKKKYRSLPKGIFQQFEILTSCFAVMRTVLLKINRNCPQITKDIIRTAVVVVVNLPRLQN